MAYTNIHITDVNASAALNVLEMEQIRNFLMYPETTIRAPVVTDFRVVKYFDIRDDYNIIIIITE